MFEYVSYEDVKTELGITGTGDDTLLRDMVTQASRQFDQACRGRFFYPLSEVRYFDHPLDDATRLMLRGDLLEVTTFTTQNGDESVSSDEYYLMCGNRYDLTPYDRIVMATDGSRPNLLYSGTIQKANAVTGLWGYHEDWANAWQDSGDTVQDGSGINASVTSLTVTDADGAGIYGMTPRFRVQDTLKIGSEYLYVTAKNTTTNVLTVRRGVNGTTAAIHANAATIYVYRAMDDIRRAVLRWAAWLYRRKDAQVFDKTAYPEMGVVTVPSSLPVDIKAVVDRYRRQA